MSKTKIYLAGGFKTNWQKEVEEKVDATFYNPRIKELEKPAFITELSFSEYGTWDLHYIKQCELVFAYMERTNSSGIGLSGELGFAKGIGRTVILCLEKNNMSIGDNHLEFMKKLSDVIYTDFYEAVEYLKLYNK